MEDAHGQLEYALLTESENGNIGTGRCCETGYMPPADSLTYEDKCPKT